jgi:hypothetical protein
MEDVGSTGMVWVIQGEFGWCREGVGDTGNVLVIQVGCGLC